MTNMNDITDIENGKAVVRDIIEIIISENVTYDWSEGDWAAAISNAIDTIYISRDDHQAMADLLAFVISDADEEILSYVAVHGVAGQLAEWIWVGADLNEIPCFIRGWGIPTITFGNEMDVLKYIRDIANDFDEVAKGECDINVFAVASEAVGRADCGCLCIKADEDLSNIISRHVIR